MREFLQEIVGFQLNEVLHADAGDEGDFLQGKPARVADGGQHLSQRLVLLNRMRKRLVGAGVRR